MMTVSSDVLATTLSDLRGAKGDRKKMASIALGKTKKTKNLKKRKNTKKPKEGPCLFVLVM